MVVSVMPVTGSGLSVPLATGFADRHGGPDLLGEHAHVEGTRWRIRLDVLAVRLVALDEVVSRVHQTGWPCQPDEYRLGHDGTPELAGAGPARVQSSGPYSRWTGAAGPDSTNAPAVLSFA